jgi:hypothetical protein
MAYRIKQEMLNRPLSLYLSSLAICALMWLVSGCKSEGTKDDSSSSHAGPLALVSTSQTKPASRGRVSIWVHMTGMAVRAGWYRLPEGATVHEAMNAALKKDGFIDWRWPYNGIYRGKEHLIWFSYNDRATDEQILLRDRDEVQLSREHY